MLNNTCFTNSSRFRGTNMSYTEEHWQDIEEEIN